MPSFRILIQRLAICIATMALGYGISHLSSKIGTNHVLSGFWGLALMLSIYFVGYFTLARPAMVRFNRLGGGSLHAIVTAFIVYPVTLTLLYSASTEAAALIAPTLVIVSSWPALLLWLFSIMFTVCGMLFGLRFTPSTSGN